MTSTFSFKTSHKCHLQVPPSSPFFQMPNVFVIPPEEEQFETPPFCYFDAAEASPSTSTQYSTNPDFDSLDRALNLINQPESTPVFHRSQPHSDEDIIMPRKREKRSRLEYISDSTVEEFQTVSQNGNDSMVVEVIKVRRSDTGDVVGASAMKRSKTFKSRASKAFRSLKNVGRSRKPSAMDVWSPNIGTQAKLESTEELQPDIPSRPARPKRSSIILSQLFQSQKGRSTHDLGSNTETSQSYLIRADTSPSLDSPPELPMDTNSDMTGRRTSSPTPSIAKSTSSKNRFSILDLHRLFSFSNSASPDPTLVQPMSPPSASSTPSMSREPSTSSTSTDTPDTPMDVEDAYPVAKATPHSTIRRSLSFRDSAESVKDYGEGEWRSTLVLDEPGRGDIGYEMRLDSLHFDSLSFDPDYF